MCLKTCAKRLERFWKNNRPFLLILTRKGVETLAVVYATLIIKGKKTFADVPERLKEQVREILIALDCPELAE